jgi:hypothetical protein
MMPNDPNREEADRSKSRPFPWRCARCRQITVNPEVIAYHCEVPYEGRVHAVVVPQLTVPRCRNCGELAFGNDASDQISEAVRRHLGLLTAEQIRQARQTLGLTIPELDARLGVGPDSIADYEHSLKIQSRALDRYLRAFFAVPQLRAVLSDTAEEPRFGNLVVT